MNEFHPDEVFTIPEVERGCGLPSRSVEMLKREGVLPKPVTKAGRGLTQKWDFKALSRMSAIAAFNQQIGSMTAAARLATHVVSALEHKHGSIPFGMQDFSRIIDSGQHVRDQNGELMQFAVFKAARRQNMLDPMEFRENDYCIAIADGEIVFEEYRGRLKRVSEDTLGESFAPIYRLRSAAGKSNSFTVETLDGNLEQEAVALRTLKNSLCTIHLNLSLSLRRVLTNIADERAMRGE